MQRNTQPKSDLQQNGIQEECEGLQSRLRGVPGQLFQEKYVRVDAWS